MASLLNKKYIKIILAIIILTVITITIILGIIKNNKKETIDISASNNTDILIRISGEVNKPGEYSVPVNTKLSDAINLAGGLTSNANINTISMDSLITSSQDIVITNKENINDNKLININLSSINELMMLPGIGESKAKAIIDYRERNGNFKKIEDIMNVSGISLNVFNKIKDYIII